MRAFRVPPLYVQDLVTRMRARVAPATRSSIFTEVADDGPDQAAENTDNCVVRLRRNSPSGGNVSCAAEPLPAARDIPRGGRDRLGRRRA